jgi:uncharacterized membrane protein YeaQ/YmgE (transglycosylase-associated protein family)
MGLLAFLIFGLIAGAVAQLLLPGDDPGGRGPLGIVITIAVGIIGAFVGGFIGSFLGLGSVTGFNFGSFALAILGAVLALAVWRALAGRPRRA